MQAAYGLDVLDPDVPPRRVWVLSQRLPPWARRPGEDWSVESELLALIVDSIADLTWLVSRLGGSTNATRPRPLPRPVSRAARERRAEPLSEPRGGGSAGHWGETVAALTGMAGVAVVRDG
jgi:hypothetical protein